MFSKSLMFFADIKFNDNLNILLEYLNYYVVLHETISKDK